MRIPFPERIPLAPAALFAVLLGMVQVVQGTDPQFCLMTIIFLVAAVLGFNYSGGFVRPSGSYIFFFALLAVVLGLIVKVFIGEAADFHLHSPLLTMRLYTVAIIIMSVAAYGSRRFSSRESLLPVLDTEKLGLAARGCLVGGLALPFVAGLIGSLGETAFTPVLAAIFQLNRFVPMAIILGTTYTIRSSGGRRSVNAVVLIAAGYLLFIGTLINFSKESLFAAPLCWLLSAVALGYRFERYQIVGGLLALVLFSRYLVPYCQYGRAFRNPDASFSDDLKVSLDLLGRLEQVRTLYQVQQENIGREGSNDYFATPQGIFDRLQMFGIDDALVTVTDQQGPYGLLPLASYVGNAVPRVIWKNKPSFNFANVYGREVGSISEEDYVTSISFSPVAEAFHLARWPGVLLILPPLFFLLFLVMDSLCGDVRKSPWGILVITIFAHYAPEGLVGGTVYLLTFGVIIVSSVAFFAAYIMPILASFVGGSKRKVELRRALSPVRATFRPNPPPSELIP